MLIRASEQITIECFPTAQSEQSGEIIRRENVINDLIKLTESLCEIHFSLIFKMLR